MTWNEDSGTVSRAFDDWKWNDRENRAFLRLSSQWSDKAYQQTWNEAEESFAARFDPDRHYGDEHLDIFEDAVDGLWPHSYAWITEASVVKNAVTAFEVYLEKALQEALGSSLAMDGKKHTIKLASPPKFESPGWKTLVTAHKILGTEVETDEVTWARELRHLLTHQNGELRSKDALARFRDLDAERGQGETDRAHIGGKVPLGAPRVLKILDSLAAVIRMADAPAWAMCWSLTGRERWSEVMTELYMQKCIVVEPV
ncbi:MULTISPECIES: hypothetical protein [Streptomyces]|uniref:hypothetical protein n=1 Tax=Streptomyces TaxID=1883 RepID=UPI002256FCE0|nr:hypothetical protein [Streptomyces viridodiastaticus]MCX4564760.1 hypothetical protein [Streptomyces viridodiastaticus]